MSDLNNDIQATGVPTLDHRTFVMKVFFPGVTDNPVIEECKVILYFLLKIYLSVGNVFLWSINKACFELTFGFLKLVKINSNWLKKKNHKLSWSKVWENVQQLI